MLETVAGLAATVLKPARDLTNSVKLGMDDFLHDANATRVQAHTKQIGWVSQIMAADQLLMGVSDDDNDPDYIESGGLHEQAEEKFRLLQDWLDPDIGGTNENDPHNDAWKTANQYLGNAAMGLVGTNPSATEKALAGSQSIRLSLLKGKGEDNALIALCDNFTNTVESIPEFPE